MGCLVGDDVTGLEEGNKVGSWLGMDVGGFDGILEGSAVGCSVGALDGTTEGGSVGS